MITMYNKEKGMRVPLKIWTENIHDIEPQCLEQGIQLASHPKVFHHVSLMPDTHFGIGMPIGGVIGTKDAIIPAAVGVDIGCGMCAVKTDLEYIGYDQIRAIMGHIRGMIPVGFAHHNGAQKWDGFDRPIAKTDPVIKKELKSAMKQLGTLGGGNHFIEIQRGDDGHIWYMIHSGSRNIGYKIANHYIQKAKLLCSRFESKCPQDLAFIPKEDLLFNQYVNAMNFALDFAEENRNQMLDNIKMAFDNVIPNVKILEQTNIHHNYAVQEHHFGENVWIHRKGATQARTGTIGIIPGSQGTKSYIVRGLGSEESFNSCSHGAGRLMSRSQAKKQLSLEDEIKKMDAAGVVHGIRNLTDLDEAPSAYKDIDIVMNNQKDLVEVVTMLQPLGVIKG